MSYDLGIKVKNKKLSESFVDFLNQQGEKYSYFNYLTWNNVPYDSYTQFRGIKWLIP